MDISPEDIIRGNEISSLPEEEKPKKKNPSQMGKQNESGILSKDKIMISLVVFFGLALVGLPFLSKMIKQNKTTEEEGPAAWRRQAPVLSMERGNEESERDNGIFQSEQEEISEEGIVESQRTPMFSGGRQNPTTSRAPESTPPPQPQPSSTNTTPARTYLSQEEILARRAPMIRSEISYDPETGDVDRPQAVENQPFIPYDQFLEAASQSYNYGGSGSDSFVSQNQQDQKNDFFEQGRGEIFASESADQYTLTTGTIIPAILHTGINTDTPGFITAIVDSNVYDSLTFTNLLIPQGTKLVGQYNSNVSYGQSRIQVAYTKMIRPDGTIINIGNMPGVDSEGYSGGDARVNGHPWQYAKAFGLISLMTIAQTELNNSIENAATAGMADLIEANASTAIDIGNRIIERTLDIQPTLTMRPGEEFNIFVSNELRLPPVDAPEVTERYTLD